MGRIVVHTNIASRASRAKLATRAKPYWFPLDQGLHLGYRKLGKGKGGSWIVRRRRSVPEAGKGPYREAWLGAADDSADAPTNVAVISYSVAQGLARAKNAEWMRDEEGLSVAKLEYTVKDAITDYLEQFPGKTKRETETTAKAHILPALGPIKVKNLSAKKIRAWHRQIAESPPRVRTKKGTAQQFKGWGDVSTWSLDQIRMREATANRVLTILKAALNHAFESGDVDSDDQWRRVAPFGDVDTPAIRYVAPDECVRLVNACQGDFRLLVKGAILSGCRYSELARLVAGNFNPTEGTLFIAHSKSGKSRHVYLTDEGRAFYSSQTSGKAHGALIFTRADGEAWGKGHQKRPLDEACKAAKIVPPITFHSLRHFHGSALATNGVPMKIIAEQLGHKDTRITERHYAHLAPGAAAQSIRANFPSLGIVEPSNVKAIGSKQ